MTASDLPVALRLTGRRVVVVGAGEVAARKVATLAPADPAMAVVAPEATDALADAAARDELTWHARRYRTSDLAGAWLVVAATGDPATDAAVAADADAAGVWCVRTDGHGSAAFAATVRRGPLTVAVSTGGGGPALSARLRAELDQALGAEWGELATLVADLRADPEVRAALAACDGAERSRRWRAVVGADTLSMIRRGEATRAREVARSCLCSPVD